MSAAYKNFSVKNSTKRYLGIWHAQVLSLSIEDSYPGNGDVATSLKLSIGEPGVDGFSSELQVPWAPGCVACSSSRAIVLMWYTYRILLYCHTLYQATWGTFLAFLRMSSCWIVHILGKPEHPRHNRFGSTRKHAELQPQACCTYRL